MSFFLLQLSNSFLRILAAPNKAVFSNSPILIVTPSFSSHASNLLLTTPSAPTTTGTTYYYYYNYYYYFYYYDMMMMMMMMITFAIIIIIIGAKRTLEESLNNNCRLKLLPNFSEPKSSCLSRNLTIVPLAPIRQNQIVVESFQISTLSRINQQLMKLKRPYFWSRKSGH